MERERARKTEKCHPEIEREAIQHKPRKPNRVVAWKSASHSKRAEKMMCVLKAKNDRNINNYRTENVVVDEALKPSSREECIKVMIEMEWKENTNEE